jgi:outer membrane protein assembly factor BamA
MEKYTHKKICIMLLSFLGTVMCINAQSSFTLHYTFLDKDSSFLQSFEEAPPLLSDTASLDSRLEGLTQYLQFQSYLEASIDSLTVDSLERQARAFVHVGPSFQWAALRKGELEKQELRAIRLREKDFFQQKLSFSRIREVQKSLLDWAGDEGYPFAEAGLENVFFMDSTVSAELFLKRNRFIQFDGVAVEGNANISDQYLLQYLDLRPGTPYSEKRVRNIRRRIEELPFLKEKRDVVVTFQGDKATVNLFLEKKRSSRFDFLLGLQPRDQALEAQQQQRLILTGNLNADLFNPFGLGERIRATFEQLRPGTQELQLGFNLPYAFGLRFGTDSQLELYKRDSTYLDVIYDLGVQYLFEGNNYLKIFWNRTATNLLNINDQAIRQSQRLPENLDVVNATYGLEYQMQNLDYRFNPRSGWEVKFRGGAGLKRIRESNLILSLTDSSDTFDYGSLYDSLELSSFQHRAHFKAALYLPVMERSTFKLGMTGGYLFSEEGLFQNELYRIGGNKLLRGFDEETIFSSLFSVLTLEYRLLLGQNDYLFVFTDLSYTERKTLERFSADRPLGFGAGLTFETKVGLFGLSLAWGRQQQNPIDFSAPKVHFGYVSLF